MRKSKTDKKCAVKSIDSVSDLFNFLFEACNILRGPIGQDSFKEYVTPILYFKRISDVWDEETEQGEVIGYEFR